MLIRLELEGGPPGLRHLALSFQFPVSNKLLAARQLNLSCSFLGVRYLGHHGSMPVSQGHCHSAHKEAPTAGTRTVFIANGIHYHF
jgi:hypothetical protein